MTHFTISKRFRRGSATFDHVTQKAETSKTSVGVLLSAVLLFCADSDEFLPDCDDDDVDGEDDERLEAAAAAADDDDAVEK